MNSRTPFIMTIAVLIGFAAIFLMNMTTFFGKGPAQQLSPYEVRGSAVEHTGQLYTLGFEQQNRLIDILNRSTPISTEQFEQRKALEAAGSEVQKVVIYLFNKPDLEIYPVALVNKSDSTSEKAMVFSISPKKDLFEEASPGELQKLFSTAYDKP